MQRRVGYNPSLTFKYSEIRTLVDMKPEIIRNSGADMNALFDEIRDLRDRTNDALHARTPEPKY